MDTILLCLYRLRAQAYSHRSKTGRSWRGDRSLSLGSDSKPTWRTCSPSNYEEHAASFLRLTDPRRSGKAKLATHRPEAFTHRQRRAEGMATARR